MKKQDSTLDEKIRFNGIDCLKAIAAFLVVCIHAPFPGMFGIHFKAITSIAVPVFFMITGFFIGNPIKSLKKLLLFFLELEIGYLVLRVIEQIVLGKSVIDYLIGLFNVKNVLSFVLLNSNHLS